MSLISHTAWERRQGAGGVTEMSRLRACNCLACVCVGVCLCVCVAWQLISNGNCANKLTNLRATFTPGKPKAAQPGHAHQHTPLVDVATAKRKR